MYAFLLDAWAVLRMRFKTAAEYRYSVPVVLAVLLLLSLIGAVSMVPVFGNTPAMIGLAVILTVLKWLILSRVMQGFLHYQGAPNVPLYGFILLTEALAIPMLLLWYLPGLALLGMVWQFWIFWVQINGLVRLSGSTGLMVVLGYLIYFAAVVVAGMAVLGLFFAVGWVDMQMLTDAMQKMQTPP